MDYPTTFWLGVLVGMLMIIGLCFFALHFHTINCTGFRPLW